MTCKCGQNPRLTKDELVNLLQTVRVGGLLLTRDEAVNVARRIELAEAQKSLR